MTYIEFKFCCMLFRSHFEGKKYKEVIKNGFHVMRDFVIDKTLMVDRVRFCFNTQETVLYFQNGFILINGPSAIGDIHFKIVEDFLNYFKIPFKDIV